MRTSCSFMPAVAPSRQMPGSLRFFWGRELQDLKFGDSETGDRNSEPLETLESQARSSRGHCLQCSPECCGEGRRSPGPEEWEGESRKRVSPKHDRFFAFYFLNTTASSTDYDRLCLQCRGDLLQSHTIPCCLHRLHSNYMPL